jgi:hypothetical protein
MQDAYREADPRWMTLRDAIAHIQSVEKCDSVAAQVLLKLRVRRRAVPTKWAHPWGLKDTPDPDILSRSQLSLGDIGLAPGYRRLRRLLVLRAAILESFPSVSGQGNATSIQTNTPLAKIPGFAFAEVWSLVPGSATPEEWTSLVKAIEHIRMVPHCDQIEALRQLKNEIKDGMLPAKWATI